MLLLKNFVRKREEKGKRGEWESGRERGEGEREEKNFKKLIS
jgi:hypothetical protein